MHGSVTELFQEICQCEVGMTTQCLGYDIKYINKHVYKALNPSAL